MEIPAGREPIAAIATPSGRGGVGVIRISGSGIKAVCGGILGCLPQPRVATLLPFLDQHGAVIDKGIALYFPQPQSYTGEDVLELQAHGGRVILDLLMTRVLELGARMARPGEFSERAFLNQKIDLVQAEAIADLIEASTAQAARSASNSMQGSFSLQVNQLVDELVELRTYVEAAIDFTEEEIDFISIGTLSDRIQKLDHGIKKVRETARQGCLLRDGMTLVIAGKPNSGKSSLLNLLAGKEVAIVTNRPGTTRDLLREKIQIDGMPVHVVDTAGLRTTDDPVEQEGVRRAHQEILRADRVLWMIDATDPADQMQSELTFAESVPVTKIMNKIDLTGVPPKLEQSAQGTEIALSVKTGAGMDLLVQHLKDAMGYDEHVEDTFIARRRHLDALAAAAKSIDQAQLQLDQCHTVELVAEELRLTQNSLSEITGKFTTDDLLQQIFSSFCIGK